MGGPALPGPSTMKVLPANTFHLGEIILGTHVVGIDLQRIVENRFYFFELDAVLRLIPGILARIPFKVHKRTIS